MAVGHQVTVVFGGVRTDSEALNPSILKPPKSDAEGCHTHAQKKQPSTRFEKAAPNESGSEPVHQGPGLPPEKGRGRGQLLWVSWEYDFPKFLCTNHLAPQNQKGGLELNFVEDCSAAGSEGAVAFWVEGVGPCMELRSCD